MADASGKTRGERALGGVVGRPSGAVVPVRQQNVLAVRVPVDVEPDALVGLELLSKSDEGRVLGGVTGGDALVGLGARAGGGAPRELPLVGPVAVDVGSDARGAGAGLAVLAPEALVGLGVDEAFFKESKENKERSGEEEETYHRG